VLRSGLVLVEDRILMEKGKKLEEMFFARHIAEIHGR
jgi:hypothetical protein